MHIIGVTMVNPIVDHYLYALKAMLTLNSFVLSRNLTLYDSSFVKAYDHIKIEWLKPLQPSKTWFFGPSNVRIAL